MSAPCKFHDAECSFSGMEDDRCPWCHLPWLAIRREGVHACERLSTWFPRLLTYPEARAKMRKAGRLRRAAAQQGEP